VALRREGEYLIPMLTFVGDGETHGASLSRLVQFVFALDCDDRVGHSSIVA
jgi:hypothetical protein